MGLCVANAPTARAQAKGVKRVFLALFVNEVDKGHILAVLEDQEIWVSVDGLHKAGVQKFTGKQRPVRGESYVLLSSLAPDVTYTFDPHSGELRLTVAPSLLPATTIEMRSIRPEGLSYQSSLSAFLNYSLNLQNGGGLSSFVTPSLFSESGISMDKTLLYNSFYTTPQETPVRLLSSVIVDDTERLARLTLGDAIANAGLLGGQAYMGGITYATNFALDPYFIYFPSPTMTGALTMPSTAYVYINGVLTRTIELPPGQFTLQDLPLQAGAGNAQVVIRNPFGVQQTLMMPYYLSTSVLKTGLQQYSYSLGYVRENFGISNFDYTQPAVSMWHRYGLTDWLTPGFFFQSQPGLYSGGPELTLRLPVGQLGLNGAFSRSSAGSGVSGAVSYIWLAPSSISFGGLFQYTSPHFATLGLLPQYDRPLLAANLFAGIQLTERVSITPSLIYNDFRDAGRSWAASVIGMLQLGHGLNLQINVSRSYSVATRTATDVYVALNWAFGSTIATAFHDSYMGEGVNVQRGLPLGPGYGYQVQAQTGPLPQGLAQFQYNGDYGYYELDESNVGGHNLASLTLAGGLVAIGGNVFATRPIQDSYALIRVPDVKGVTGYLSNQPMGKTDSNGDLLVPDLISYYGNDLAIKDTDIPVNYDVGATHLTVATPYRGGAVVTFPVSRRQAFLGRLKISRGGKLEIPSFGEIDVAAPGKPSSPIGRRGEFYLENIPPGRYRAVVHSSAGDCQMTLQIPKSSANVVKLGDLTCVQQ